MNLINQNKVYKTGTAYNSISITVGNRQVVGMLQEQITYSVEANYNTIFSLDSFFSSLNNALALTFEKRVFGTGMYTKRFWKGGGYLRITPKFRIVDHEGDGFVIDNAIQILNSALPQNDLSVLGDEKNQNYDANIAPGAPFIVAGAGALAGAGYAMLKKSGPLGYVLPTTIGALAGAGAERVLNDPTKIKGIIDGVSTNFPTPVVVEISNYFEKVFVVESANVTFSQEMIETKDGKITPLYADFECTFGTQEVTTFGNTGLKNTGKRFKIE